MKVVYDHFKETIGPELKMLLPSSSSQYSYNKKVILDVKESLQSWCHTSISKRGQKRMRIDLNSGSGMP